MSHFSTTIVSWKKEHLEGLSTVFQQVAPNVNGVFGKNKLVTNRYSVCQFMQVCLEFDDMAPVGLVLAEGDTLALCYDAEQEHFSSQGHHKRLHDVLVALTQAMAAYKGKLETEKLLELNPTSIVSVTQGWS